MNLFAKSSTSISGEVVCPGDKSISQRALILGSILNEDISIEGFYWLLAGGISYTIGAVLYSIQRIKYNHAIFHVLVLLGSFCHFISIYFYV